MKKQKIALLISCAFALTSCGGTDKPTHVHNLEHVNQTNPTCTQEGTEAYYKCSVCEDMFSDQEGKNKIDAPAKIPALGHKTKLHEGVDATCTTEGVQDYYTCENCDLLFSDKDGKNKIDAPIKIEALGHKLLKFDGVESTCVSEGFETYYKCSGCAKMYSDAAGTNEIKDPIKIPLKAHNLNEVAKVEGDCTHDTVDAHFKCLDCNKYFRDKDGKIETTLEELTHDSGISHNMTFHKGYPVTDAADGRKDYYECSLCNKMYEDEAGNKEITDVTIKSEGWAYFAPGFETIAIGESPKDNISTEPYTLKDNMIANKVTLKKGTLSGHSYNLKPLEDQPTNTRTCLFAGVDTGFKLTVTNSGTETISFRYFLDNYGDKGGVDIDELKAGETRTVEFSVNWEVSTQGCYHGITLKNDLNSDVSLIMNGYFSTLGRVDGKIMKLEPLHDAKVKSFTTGDTFTSEGVVARLSGGPNADSSYTKIYNYVTNYDGHVFGLEDVGKQKVKVMFGGSYYEYEINVIKAHVHEVTKVEKKEATDVLDGHEEYYACSSCDKIFADSKAENEVTYDDIKIKSEGWASFAPGLTVCVEGKDVSDTDNISAQAVKLDSGLYANQITISPDKEAKSFWMKPYETDPFNSRTVLWENVDTTFKVTVTNRGKEAVSFRYFLDDYGDKAGANIDDLKPNETRTFEFGTPSWPSTTPGCYHGLKLTKDITQDAVLEFNGVYSLHQKVDGEQMLIKKHTDAKQLKFNVGDKFNHEGLRTRLLGGPSNDGSMGAFIDNVVTNFDNYTFEEKDIGKQTVKVMFGGSSYEYQIEVYAKHEHTIVKKETVDPTDIKNGISEHYECDHCHQVYADAEGKEIASLKDFDIQSEGLASFMPGLTASRENDHQGNDTDEIDAKAVTLDDGRMATNVTLTKDAPLNQNYWLIRNDSDPANSKTPLANGVETKFKMTFINNGTEVISFRYYFDNYGDKGGVEVENLQPGETRNVEFVVNFDTTNRACYHGLKLKSQLTADASLTICGQYSTVGLVNGKNLSIVKTRDADKLKFKVGDKFTTKGLVASFVGSGNGISYNGITVENYFTNLDNHIFTAEDVGTQQVVVTFAGSSFVYEIEVVA